jgi:hypothetical protein
VQTTDKFPIKQLLINAIDGSATELEFGELARIFLAFARQLVRRKIFSGKLQPHRVGLSETDIAHDCIADIFRRNANNQLTVLMEFFNKQLIQIDKCSDEFLLSNVRMFVFRFVEDNIFKIYHDIDSAYSNILKNLKVAIRKSNTCIAAVQFGEQYFTFDEDENCSCLPTIDDDELEIIVSEILDVEDKMNNLLYKLQDRLGVDNKKKHKIRLSTLAAAIKSGFEVLHLPEAPSTNSAESSLHDTDTKMIISESCAEVTNEMKPRYVDKGKVDSLTFSNYINAIKEILTEEFVTQLDGEKSFFEYLREFDLSISKDEYLQKHRVVMDYLMKIAKKRTIEKLKLMKIL